MIDLDVQGMSVDQLRVEVMRLRNEIRQHRDEEGHDRCWLDDQRLYDILPDDKKANFVLPDREEFLENCARYWVRRRKDDSRDVESKVLGSEESKQGN